MKTEEIKEQVQLDLEDAVEEFVIACRLNGDLDDEIMEGIIAAIKIGSNDEFSVREL